MSRQATVHGARLQVRDSWHVLGTPALIRNMANDTGYRIEPYYTNPLEDDQRGDFMRLGEAGLNEKTTFKSVYAATAVIAAIYNVKPQRKLLTCWYDMPGYNVRIVSSQQNSTKKLWMVRCDGSHRHWLMSVDATIEQRNWKTRSDAVAAVVDAHHAWMQQLDNNMPTVVGKTAA